MTGREANLQKKADRFELKRLSYQEFHQEGRSFSDHSQQVEIKVWESANGGIRTHTPEGTRF